MHNFYSFCRENKSKHTKNISLYFSKKKRNIKKLVFIQLRQFMIYGKRMSTLY